jgi:chaperone required for assembly of F1-ATPase
MKRFWREASVVAAADGHQVLLDERLLRTPARRPLAAPTAALAAAIAAEWQAQDETVRPDTMPLTRLASTVVDRMPELRDAALDELTDFARTDLVCYRAAEPLALVERQSAAWGPILDWLHQTFGVRLRVTTELWPIAQVTSAILELRRQVERLEDWHLVGLHGAVQPLGSVVLGLAVLHGRLDAMAALDASLLDELFEIEHWGADEQIERRHAALRQQLEAVTTYLDRLSPPAII